MLKSTVQLADGGKVFCFFFSSRKTNSLLENQNCFIDLTFTQLEQEQIKTFCFLFFLREKRVHGEAQLTKKLHYFKSSLLSGIIFL